MAKRYVMGNRPDGLSDILFEDELLPTVGRTRELWINHETPADMSAAGDAAADLQMVHEPPDGGALFRALIYPPKGQDFARTPEEMVAHHHRIHSVHIPSLEYLREAKHVTMHRTDTLNYFVVTEGEVWALSEGRDVLLKAGDVIIQKGCMHGWRNDSDRRCVVIATLIDANSPI